MAEVSVVAFGLFWTMVLGLGVGPFVRMATTSVGELSPPSARVAEEWKALTERNKGGFWIGWIERPIFFAAFWMPGSWLILSSWLIFKLAVYWQSSNFAQLPNDPPEVTGVRYLTAKWKLGTHQTTTLLVGTGANIILALFGVAVGRLITSLP